MPTKPDTTEEKERSALNSALSNPVVIRAFEQSLADMWREKRGKTSVEESALAYQHYDGACELLAKLYSKSKSKPRQTAPHKGLRH